MKTHKIVINGQTHAVTIKKHHWSKRISMSVKRNAAISVTIPRRLSYQRAIEFIEGQRRWLEDRLPAEAAPARHAAVPARAQREQARTLVEHKLQQWGPALGVQWGRVSIRNQSTRWGSCSANGNLNFNWRIIQLPPELQDYLIIHELAHLKQHNHSPQFWALVQAVLPDYKVRRQLLKNQTLR